MIKKTPSSETQSLLFHSPSRVISVAGSKKYIVREKNPNLCNPYDHSSLPVFSVSLLVKINCRKRGEIVNEHFKNGNEGRITFIKLIKNQFTFW